MVLVTREEKRAIFAEILKEGVIVVRKDGYLPQHQQIKGVSNLKVMMIVKSLKSRGYLNGVFNWQWNYYSVTSSGVQYIAQALGVPRDVVPVTYKTKKRVAAPAAEPKVADEDEKPQAAEETPAAE